jgi:hypothetical protein
MNIVQLQARNLSEFCSVQEKEASSNDFSSLEGGPLVVVDQSNAFKICKFHMFHKSCKWIPTKPNDGEAKGLGYLNIEHFVQWKLILIKTKNYRGISAHFWYFWKAFNE